MSSQAPLARMRWIANGSLAACVVLLGACRFYEAVFPWLAWPRSFFEAATVGAMADWFAVVALFRHPLGIPLKHTAILPRNKERVAESLASFLETSFLTEQQLGPRFRSLDYAAFASVWLQQHAELLASRAAAFAPKVIAGLPDEAMSDLLARRAKELIQKADLGPLAGEGIEVIVQNGRDREIFVSVLKSSKQVIEDHRRSIESKIREEIPLSADLLAGVPFLKDVAGPLLDQARDSIACAVAAKTIEKVQAALEEACLQPSHPLYLSFDARLKGLITDLKSSPEMAEKIRAMQESLAGSRMVAEFAAKSWQEVREFILADCAREDSSVRQKVAEAILTAARQLSENETARREINAFLGDQVLQAMLAAKPHARELVVTTVREWDAGEMSEKLEATVGADLQFIRLNGTFVGGLIGLLIHAVFWALGK